MPIACSGQSTAASSPAPATATATITLTAGGCQYSGPSQMRPGRLTVHLVDQTTDTFWLGLGLIENGHTYNDLVAWIDADRARQLRASTASGILIGHPRLPKHRRRAVPAPTSRRTWSRQGPTFACGRLDLKAANPELGVWALGPLIVFK
ncbi:MAG TPA: hypothetical protein VLR46_12185 [Candidatus Dormibacteraeota bacterium]|nr:hypothetical protein [Candidatus Dormibacteraeota bacterium]